MISLIIPHHGNRQQLQRLLDSIPHLDLLEVITIEDKDRRGAGWARNQGLMVAKGEYVMFADSDDWFLPELESMLRELQDCTADIIYFNATSVEEHSGATSHRTARLNWIMSLQDERRDFLLRHTFTEPWCHIIRRSLIDTYSIRFDETPILNDVTFTTLCGYYAKSIKVVPTKAYCVCNRKGSVGKIRDKARRLAYTEVLAKTNAFNRDHAIDYRFMKMVMPLINGLAAMRWREVAECYRIIRHHGFSPLHIAWLLTRWPADVATWAKEKFISGLGNITKHRHNEPPQANNSNFAKQPTNQYTKQPAVTPPNHQTTNIPNHQTPCKFSMS